MFKCLNHKGTAQQWAQYFTSYSKDEANALVEKEKARSEMEKSITEMLKISSWSADPGTTSPLSIYLAIRNFFGLCLPFVVEHDHWCYPKKKLGISCLRTRT